MNLDMLIFTYDRILSHLIIGEYTVARYVWET